MTKPIIRVYTEIGKFVDREMNEEEFAQYQADQAAEIALQKSEAAKAKAKANLLDKLGITEDEAKLLLS